MKRRRESQSGSVSDDGSDGSDSVSSVGDAGVRSRMNASITIEGDEVPLNDLAVAFGVDAK
ncbi:hypothetical protein HDU96_003787, partial [Phlyctochytrium bullatum]